MAQPWCTGAAHVYLGLAGGFKPLYLGTCESKPGLEGQVKYDPVMNDLSGGQVPFDYSFQGEIGIISVTLTRYEEATYQLATRLPNPFSGARGSFTSLDMGTLMGLEGMAFPLWIQFPYAAAKTSMAGSERGRRYAQCITYDRVNVEGGTRAKKIGLIFLAWPKYAPKSGGFTLYDEDMSQVVGVTKG